MHQLASGSLELTITGSSITSSPVLYWILRKEAALTLKQLAAMGTISDHLRSTLHNFSVNSSTAFADRSQIKIQIVELRNGVL